jgi:hypothetical protein
MGFRRISPSCFVAGAIVFKGLGSTPTLLQRTYPKPPLSFDTMPKDGTVGISTRLTIRRQYPCYWGLATNMYNRDRDLVYPEILRGAPGIWSIGALWLSHTAPPFPLINLYNHMRVTPTQEFFRHARWAGLIAISKKVCAGPNNHHRIFFDVRRRIPPAHCTMTQNEQHD